MFTEKNQSPSHVMGSEKYSLITMWTSCWATKSGLTTTQDQMLAPEGRQKEFINRQSIKQCSGKQALLRYSEEQKNIYRCDMGENTAVRAITTVLNNSVSAMSCSAATALAWQGQCVLDASVPVCNLVVWMNLSKKLEGNYALKRLWIIHTQCHGAELHWPIMPLSF